MPARCSAKPRAPRAHRSWRPWTTTSAGAAPRAHRFCHPAGRYGRKGGCIMDTELFTRCESTFTGAGLFICFQTSALRAQETAQLPTRVAAPADFNAFLKIGEDGRVQCLV